MEKSQATTWRESGSFSYGILSRSPSKTGEEEGGTEGGERTNQGKMRLLLDQRQLKRLSSGAKGAGQAGKPEVKDRTQIGEG